MLKRIAFIFYVSLSFWIVIRASHGAFQTVGMPFAGFLPFKNLYVGAFIQPWWQGHDLQLSYNDRVVELMEQKNPDIVTWKNALDQQTKLPVEFKDKDQVTKATLSVDRLQPSDVLSIFGVLFLTGSSFLLMGLLAWLIHPSPSGMTAFAVYCLSIGTYFLSAYDFHTTYDMTPFLLCSWVIVAPSTFHLAITFPRPWKRATKLLWAPYAFSLVLGIPYVYYFEKNPALWKTFESTFAIYTAFVYVVWLGIVIKRAFDKDEEDLVRQQCRTILWPIVFSFGIIFFLALLILFANLVMPMHWLAALSIVFPVSILFAMFRKNLFLVDQLETLVKQRTQQLQKVENEFYQASKLASVGLLAAGTAHEIGNAMNVIVSNIPILGKYAQTLSQALDKNSGIDEKELNYIQSDLPDLLESVNRSCKRTMNIVEDLKTFSKPGSKIKERTDLVDLIETTLRLLKPEFGHRIEVVTAFEKIPMVVVEAGQIQQVLINLLMNAIAAIPNEGHIHVSTAYDGSFVTLVIADTGVGIPQASLSRIFEPFYTTKKSGSGLGLSVSYGIIQAHGGKLSLESEPNKGTKVTLTLPVEQNA